MLNQMFTFFMCLFSCHGLRLYQSRQEKQPARMRRSYGLAVGGVGCYSSVSQSGFIQNDASNAATFNGKQMKITHVGSSSSGSLTIGMLYAHRKHEMTSKMPSYMNSEQKVAWYEISGDKMTGMGTGIHLAGAPFGRGGHCKDYFHTFHFMQEKPSTSATCSWCTFRGKADPSTVPRFSIKAGETGSRGREIKGDLYDHHRRDWGDYLAACGGHCVMNGDECTDEEINTAFGGNAGCIRKKTQFRLGSEEVF